MSFLLECPHCGLRDVNEFRYQGEVTRRPPPEPTLRELTDYVYFRDNVAGVQREWWYHRTGCGVWFVAERDTRTNEVLPHRDAGTRRQRAPDAAARRSPASGSIARGTSRFFFDGAPVDALRRRHDRLGALRIAAGACSRAASSTTGRAGSSAARASCANCMMTVDGVPNVRVCAEPVRAGAQVRGAERARLARSRPAERHRQDRRAVHARRLLLPHDDPAPAGVAAVREAPAQRSPVSAACRQDAIARALRHRAPARRRARDRRRALRARGRRGGCGGRRPARRRARRLERAAYEVLAPATCDRDLRGRPRPGRRRGRALPRPRRTHRRRDRSARAAARLPGQRPRRRDAAGRRSAAGRRLGAQAGNACRRRRSRRCRASEPADPAGVEIASGRLQSTAGQLAAKGRRGRLTSVVLGRQEDRLRPARRLRRPPARVLAARPGRRARRVRRRQRGIFVPTRPARRHRRRSARSPARFGNGRRAGASWTAAATSASSASARTSRRRT